MMKIQTEPKETAMLCYVLVCGTMAWAYSAGYLPLAVSATGVVTSVLVQLLLNTVKP